jgi:tryptophan-rich sensory protein
MNNLEIFLLLLPLVVGMGMSFICMADQSGKKSNVAPHPSVFIVVWPILFLILGYVWVEIRKMADTVTVDVLVSIIIVNMLLWLYLFNCAKRRILSFYAIVVLYSLVTSLLSITFTHSNKLGFILLPLFTWLTLAMVISRDTI